MAPRYAKKRLEAGVSSPINTSPNLPAELCQLADTKLLRRLACAPYASSASCVRALPIGRNHFLGVGMLRSGVYIDFLDSIPLVTL